MKSKSAEGKEGVKEDITSHKGAEEKGEGLGMEEVLHYGPKCMKYIKTQNRAHTHTVEHTIDDHPTLPTLPHSIFTSTTSLSFV